MDFVPLRAAPLVRAKAKITVKNAVCCCLLGLASHHEGRSCVVALVNREHTRPHTATITRTALAHIQRPLSGERTGVVSTQRSCHRQSQRLHSQNIIREKRVCEHSDEGALNLYRQRCAENVAHQRSHCAQCVLPEVDCDEDDRLRNVRNMLFASARSREGVCESISARVRQNQIPSQNRCMLSPKTPHIRRF